MDNVLFKSEVNQDVPILFKPSNWLVKIDFINHLVQLSNILMVVLAKPGAGKTSFVNLLSQSLEAKIPYCVITATESFTFANLVEELQLTFDQTDNLTLTDIITQVNLEKKHHLLIIDAAEFLSFAILKDLLVELICCEKENYFHICLVGNFTLTEPLSILEKEQRFKDIIHTIELYPLTENETKAYFLNKAPASCNVNNQMLDELFHHTKGDLALINSRIKDLSKSVVGIEKSRSKSRVLQWTSLVASILVVASLSIYFWYNEQLLIDSTVMASRSTVVIPLESKIPSFTLSSQIETRSPPPLNRVVDTSNDDEENSGLEKLVVTDSVLGLPKSNLRAYAKASLPASTLAELSSAMAKQATAIVSSSPALFAKKEDVIRTDGAQASDQKNVYTIQVLATKSKRKLTSFLAANSLKSSNIHIANREGKDWYVLTIGEFQVREQAKEVMHSLPQKIAQLHPWVRPLSDFKG